MSYSYALLLACPDRQGVVARVADFIHQTGGNIYSSHQFFDKDVQHFFARFAWTLTNQTIHSEKQAELLLAQLQRNFAPLAQNFTMNWSIALCGKKLRCAIFVSRYDHCLYDLLIHQQEIISDFICVLSNHQKLEPVAKHFGLPFYHLDFAKLGKAQAEKEQLNIIQNKQIELIILARYMQILSPEFLQHSPAPAINIHHSFLPAFKGAKPYHQAYERGVKIIGATSHYVTAELDQGPIIAQNVQTVSYQDNVEDLIRKGRSIEKDVLLQAVQAHCEQRILCFQNRTVVFPG